MGVSMFAERPTRAHWLGVACVIGSVIVLGAVT
jgi:drug/metabolite transporter (DMT)-like permease